MDMKKIVDEAIVTYYSGAEPTMSDDEFDVLFDKVYPGKNPLSLYKQLSGHRSVVELKKPMGSLSKVRTEDEVSSWVSSMIEQGATGFTLSPKWDGIAAQVVNEKDSFSVTTRGDGTIGESITQSVSLIPNVSFPEGISSHEIVMSVENMNAINSLGEATYKHPRNATSGALMRDDMAMSTYLTTRQHWVWDDVVHDTIDIDTITTFNNEVQESMKAQGETILTDGVVIQATIDGEPMSNLGVDSSQCPRWAVAFKFPSEAKVATIVDVVWQQGRIKVTPVAIFEPVDFYGVTVTKASLHNIDFITNMGIAIGDKVMLTRSNEVIPYVLSLYEKGKDRKRISLVEHGGFTLPHKVEHIIKTFEIEDAGPATVKEISAHIEDGKIPHVMKQMLALDKDDIASWDGFASGSAARLVSNISTIYSGTQVQFLTCLGIPGVGKTLSTHILSHYGSISSLVDSQGHGLTDVPKVGSRSSEAILGRFDEVIGINNFINENNINAPAPKRTSFRVTVTGKVDGASRSTIATMIEGMGGEVSSYSSKTDVVVKGAGGGSTIAKAKKNGTPIIEVSHFDEIANALKESGIL